LGRICAHISTPTTMPTLIRESEQLALTVLKDNKKSFGISVLKGVDYEGVKRDGFCVATVAPTGLAAIAKVNVGDVLLSVDGQEVTSQDALFKQLKDIPDGKEVVFTVNRVKEATPPTSPMTERSAKGLDFVSGARVPHPLGKKKPPASRGLFACCGAPADEIEIMMVTELEAAKILEAAVAEKDRLAAAAEAAKNPLSLTVVNNKKSSFGLSILQGVNYEGVKVEGFCVSNVSPGGLAASAGLMVGDVLISVDGEPVTGQEALFKQLKGIADGATVTFAVSARI